MFKVGGCLTFQDQYFPKLTEQLEEGKMTLALERAEPGCFYKVCECESFVVARGCFVFPEMA